MYDEDDNGACIAAAIIAAAIIAAPLVLVVIIPVLTLTGGGAYDYDYISTYTDNITIKDTNIGGLGTPYYVYGSDGCKYEIPLNRNLRGVYDTASRHSGETVIATIEKGCRDGKIVKSIIAITVPSECCYECCAKKCGEC